MKKKGDFVRYTAKELKKLKGKSDWNRVRNMTEEELEAAISSDPDSDPPVDWSKAFKGLPDIPDAPWKEKISIRVDRHVLDWFQKHGKGYQTRMNAVLRAFVEGQKG